MLVEWLKNLTRPAAPELRALGYLGEQIAIESRWRRCRDAWEPHLEACRRAVGEAIGMTQRRRTAVVMGSGHTIELPLEDLAHAFERVLLIDVLHPPIVHRRVRHLANVRLVEADVTGAIASLHRLGKAAPYAPPPPRRLALLDDPGVDLVVSLNLLSQLPVLPTAWLDRLWGEEAGPVISAYAAALVRWHLSELRRGPAMTCLISDVERRETDRDGRLIERHSTLVGIEPPSAERQWLWRIAPAPEIDANRSEERLVVAAFDLARRMV